MKSAHMQSIIIMISFMFISGCVGYAQQPYQHYSAPVFARQSFAPYGSYNYGGNYGGFSAAPRPYVQPGREFRDYGGYRNHDFDGGHREGGGWEGRGHHEEH
jgi:hypothetical protein